MRGHTRSSAERKERPEKTHNNMTSWSLTKVQRHLNGGKIIVSRNVSKTIGHLNAEKKKFVFLHAANKLLEIDIIKQYHLQKN